MNADGIQDANESPAANITVILRGAGNDGVFNSLDDVYKTSSTDAQGAYLFDGLAAGSYKISVDTQNELSTLEQVAINLAAGQERDDADFGLLSGAIGDTVWLDLNADGVQDADERGLAGVSVNLRFAGADGVLDSADDLNSENTQGFSTQTDNNGQYRFNDLAIGLYRVSIETNQSLSTPAAYVIVQEDAEIFTTADFGLIQNSSLGDRVWFDLNANGIQDADELGAANISVQLRYAGADGVLDSEDDLTVDNRQGFSTQTDEQGFYHFDNLDLGLYRLSLQADLPTSTATQFETTINRAGEDLSFDFGLISSLSIGDYVWFDDNVDGSQDSNEVGAAGIQLQLRNAGADGILGNADDLLQSSRTDADGAYLFDNLSAGLYQVSIDNNSIAANQILSTSGFYQLNLSQESISTADFGLSYQHQIGDKIWFDSNADGIENHNEQGVANIRISLRDAGNDGILGNGDDQIQTTQTDEQGYYNFSQLKAGSYQVSIEAEQLSTPNNYLVNLNQGNNYLAADFGLIQTKQAVIGDRVWIDSNADGVQDADESGAANVSVNLRSAGADGQFNTADDLVNSTQTDNQGFYHFDKLAADNYQISIDDNGNLSTPQLITVELGANEINLNADFGIKTSASIGDRVWFDRNADGVQDADESGAANVSVNLRSAGADEQFNTADDLVNSTETDNQGFYHFDGLAANNYQISIDDNGNLSTPQLVSIELGTTEINLNADFGLKPRASIGDRVWLDRNTDGVQDADEHGLTGVLLQLRSAGADGILGNSDDIYQQTRSDAEGFYQFSNLDIGLYQIAVISNLTSTTASDVIINLDTDQILNTVDFGLDQVQGQIGDRVWLDSNGNRIQDANEVGVENISVYLSSVGADSIQGTADDIQQLTHTDSNGQYLFENLSAQEYQVQIGDQLPQGLINKTAAISVKLGEDQQNLNIDFALENQLSAQIGDQIWFDNNRDGIQGEGEFGTGGIDLRLTEAGTDGLFDTDDDQVLRLSTDSIGHYQFLNLTAGEYRLNLDTDTLPEGFKLNTLAEQRFSLSSDETRDDLDFRLTPIGLPSNNGGTTLIMPTPIIPDTPQGTPDYHISKDDGLSQVTPGQSLIYQITIGNHGAASGSQISVIDQFPANMLDIISVSDGGIIDNSGIIRWTLDNLAPNQGKTLTINAVVKTDVSTEQLTNRVTIQDQLGIDSRIEDNSDTDTDNLIYPELNPDSTPTPEEQPNTDNGIEDQTPDQGEDTTVENDQQITDQIPVIDLEQDRFITPKIDFFNDRMIFNFVENDNRTFQTRDDINLAREQQYGYYWPNGDIQFDLPPLPVSPVFSGSVAPGTTMVVSLFDEHGSELSSQTVMADTGGNWLASFPNVILWKAPHSIQIKQQTALYNQNEMSVYDMRTYFTPAITSQLFISTPLSVQTVMAHAPIKMIRALHHAMQQPLAINWDDFSAYQFQASSSTTAQASM